METLTRVQVPSKKHSVYYAPSKKRFIVSIKLPDGSNKWIGTFRTDEEATKAFNKARDRYYYGPARRDRDEALKAKYKKDTRVAPVVTEVSGEEKRELRYTGNTDEDDSNYLSDYFDEKRTMRKIKALLILAVLAFIVVVYFTWKATRGL